MLKNLKFVSLALIVFAALNATAADAYREVMQTDPATEGMSVDVNSAVGVLSATDLCPLCAIDKSINSIQNPTSYVSGMLSPSNESGSGKIK